MKIIYTMKPDENKYSMKPNENNINLKKVK